MDNKQINIQAGLKFTSTCSYIGLTCFCVVGLVATEIMLLSELARMILVVAGALFVAIGSEMGSYYSIVAAFERAGTLRGWDVVGAIISQLATISSVLLAFVTLSGAGDTWVAEFISHYGYVLTTLFVSVDGTFNYAAMGIYRYHLSAIQLEQQRRFLEYQRENVKIQQELAQLKREEFAFATQVELYNEEKKTGPMQPAAQQTQPPVVAVVQQDAIVAQPTQLPTSKRALVVQLLQNSGHTLQQIADLVPCSYEYVRKVRAELASEK